ncbi:restriction endonuclease subunit S, partial [Helicobacter pylori]
MCQRGQEKQAQRAQPRKDFANLVFRGSIPALNKADIETLTIPIPPLEIQQEIVKILDA